MYDRKYCLVADVDPGAGLLVWNPVVDSVLPSCDPGKIPLCSSVLSSKIRDNNYTFFIGLLQESTKLINANQLK